jgi:hypothetical protein
LSYFQTENSSYFIVARHKLNAFFSLVFRFSSCHHPLLAFALAKIMEDRSNQVATSKEDNDVRQLISMISSDNHHVVHTAYFVLPLSAYHISSMNNYLFIFWLIFYFFCRLNRHAACLALSSLASNISSAMHLIKCDIMKPIEAVRKSLHYWPTFLT